MERAVGCSFCGLFFQQGVIFLRQKAAFMSTKNRRRRPERDSLKISTSLDVFHLFLQRKRAEGLVEALRVFSEGASWKEGSTRQRRGGSVRFEGITGGVQDFGVELRY